jgi:aminoglycoside phosphotransferase (APT) family kinase protein
MSPSPFPEDTQALDAWAAARVPGFVGPSVATKFAVGHSNPTYLIANTSGRYVLRRKPSGKLPASAHAIEREFRVMKALNGVGYPAPLALALCEDATVLGSAFYLMSHVEGRVFAEADMPRSNRAERIAVYDAMNAALARLHAVDYAAAGLSDFGKRGDYLARQTRRWSEQYRTWETDEIAEMNALIVWLGANAPPDDGRVALVHGDWRIDNMIFDRASPQALAVLDWELSTLGHPFVDLAYQCMQWRLPSVAGMRGWAGLDRAALGLPSEEAYVADYCRRAGVTEIPNWTFLIAFCVFRVAAMAQGVYKRAIDGAASQPERGLEMRAAVAPIARLALEMVDGSRGSESR